LGVGVDFGTSNSTIAWFDGRELHLVSLEGESPILPSAIHLNREFEPLTGSAAVAQYVEENRGRLVQLVAEEIGEEGMALGELGRPGGRGDAAGLRRVVYGPLVDRGQTGRLFQELKRLLGDRGTERLMVFQRAYRVVALITPMLERMRLALEQSTGQPVSRAHVGRPVNFEGRGARRNELALSRLAESAENAGFPQLSFFEEPVAATLSYLWRGEPQAQGTALTVDFGGGTLDLSVIRYAGTRFQVLSTAGTGLGGNRIDQMIYAKLLFPQLGEGETWRRQVDGRVLEGVFPFQEYETGLLSWPTTYLLNQNATKSKVVERIAQGGPAAVKFERLKDLISYNYSYNCFQAIRKAKAALSEVEETVLDIPEINVAIPFTRAMLDEILQPALETLRNLIGEVLAAAGVERDHISLVIRTGGSSEIVAVRRLLDELFPGKVTGHDTFTSVAGGLAIASYEGIQRHSG
jgi:hypothetical chaperone protein